MIDRNKKYNLPTTVEKAVDILVSDLTIQQMTAMGEMDDQEFEALCDQLIPYLQHDFRIWAGNDKLLSSCFDTAAHDGETDPMRIIMNAMRMRLQSLSNVIIAV